MSKYGFRIIWSDEDEGYVATSPEFPGLSAFGETQQEALAEAIAAQELFVEDMQERGEELPKPQVASEFSGQTRLRLPKSVHRLAAELAATDGISLNQFINEAIAEKIGTEKGSKRLLKELRAMFDENAEQRRSDIASAIVWKDIRGTVTEQRMPTFEDISTQATTYVRSNELRGN